MNSHKHAYLIIAHHEPMLFHTLLSILDDSRNDIFVHIDKKSNIEDFEYNPVFSRVFYVNRFDIRWGHYSQVEVELALMEAATKEDKYYYYHLLSGVDFPIKSQDYIHSFFDSLNSTKELVGFNLMDVRYMERVWYYTPFYQHQCSQKYIFRKIVNLFTRLVISCQKCIGIKREYGINIYKGAQWFSITDQFCRFVVSRKKEIQNLFSKVSCCDELFMQTLLYNYFPERIYNINSEYDGNLRAIDWNRGKPYVWGGQESDIDLLLNSGHIFARKFSSDHFWIIDRIRQMIQRQ